MPDLVIDSHVHVGLAGDRWPHWGAFSDSYRKSVVFRLFLTFARLSPDEVTDEALHQKTLAILGEARLDRVVCLALDPIYDSSGRRRDDLSHVWVDNSYITDKLRPELPGKVLFGASVHPYDPGFEARVKDCVDAGAVLLKWLPSAQEFTLADDRAGEAMKFLATAKNGRPLPLLLHTGPEYAIPPHDGKTRSYDFLSWTVADRFRNVLRFGKRWYTPDIERIHFNLRSALEAGAVVIFAHCGTPVFSGGLPGGLFEHSDFDAVVSYLSKSSRGLFAGRCYADVSAFMIPTRVPFHDKVKKLPRDLILMGSDFPVPITELSAGPAEWWDDAKAIVREGAFDRWIVPEDNLIDVNREELQEIFGDHPMFTNFNNLLE